MLRGKVGVWTIIVLICVTMQFVTTSLPSIIETCEQMDSAFEQRVLEEKEKAEALKNGGHHQFNGDYSENTGTIVE